MIVKAKDAEISYFKAIQRKPAKNNRAVIVEKINVENQAFLNFRIPLSFFCRLFFY